jgi:hypothetical protein
MPDLLWSTAISASRSVAANIAAALIRHQGSPQAQQYFDARRNLDTASIEDSLSGLAELDPSLKIALQARRQLADRLKGESVE